jgi:predicted nucleic acid-binding protein
LSKTSPTWLIDKSAYTRLGSGPHDEAWADRIDRGLVRITTLTRLELGYSARTAAEWRAELDVAPLAAMPIQYLTPAIEDRAVEVQLLLADRGQHRAPSIPDLVVAATAELAGLIVLHLDKDFDLIGEVTGQPVERLAVRDGTA